MGLMKDIKESKTLGKTKKIIYYPEGKPNRGIVIQTGRYGKEKLDRAIKKWTHIKFARIADISLTEEAESKLKELGFSVDLGTNSYGV